ncbi:MAG: hypothetical protein QW117_02060 [Candidatus Pacearchaeota archaeon]
MYNKKEIEKNLILLEHVINRDFPKAYEKKHRENIIRTNIFAELGLESLSLLKEDNYLKEVKEKIKKYLKDSKKILNKYNLE